MIFQFVLTSQFLSIHMSKLAPHKALTLLNLSQSMCQSRFTQGAASSGIPTPGAGTHRGSLHHPSASRPAAFEILLPNSACSRAAF